VDLLIRQAENNGSRLSLVGMRLRRIGFHAETLAGLHAADLEAAVKEFGKRERTRGALWIAIAG